MRTLRGNIKAQGLVEYGIILAVLLLVAIGIGTILRPWIHQLTSGLAPTSTTPTPNTTPAAEFLASTIFVITTIGTTIICSMLINLLISGQDGTKNNPVKLSAKYCLSGISFDLWGITTVLQSKGQIPYNQQFMSSTTLGFAMFMLVILHIILHKNCLDSVKKRWTPDEKSLVRLFWVFVSIGIPTVFAYFFYVPR